MWILTVCHSSIVRLDSSFGWWFFTDRGIDVKASLRSCKRMEALCPAWLKRFHGRAASSMQTFEQSWSQLLHSVVARVWASGSKGDVGLSCP